MTEPVSVPARQLSPGHTLRRDAATAAALCPRGCRLGTPGSDVSLSSDPPAPACPLPGGRAQVPGGLLFSVPLCPPLMLTSPRLLSGTTVGFGLLFLLPQSPQLSADPLGPGLLKVPGILLYCPWGGEAPDTSSLFPLRSGAHYSFFLFPLLADSSPLGTAPEGGTRPPDPLLGPVGSVLWG